MVLIEGKNGCSQYVSKWSGWNVLIAMRPSPGTTRRASASACGRSTRWSDERHRHPVEPAVTEWQPLGTAAPHADAGRERLARDGDHLGALVDAPGLRMRLADESGQQPSRATADVEDAPAAEVTELDHRRERLPPRGVGRPQRVVDAGAGAEIRWLGRAHSSGWTGVAGPRLRRAPRGTSTGSPRSAYGISITSKSRGTTVAGNTSRASSATSEPK